MGKAKRAAKPAKRTQSSIPFTKLCKCGHYNHNRKTNSELCDTTLPVKKKKTLPKSKKKQARTPYAAFQNRSAAAFEYLTTFDGDFDQAVEFLSALKPLVGTTPPNKAS